MSLSLFFILNAFANRLRGGAFDELLKLKGNTFIRVVSSMFVGFSILLIQPLQFTTFYMVIPVMVAYFLFNLFSWGLWHTMDNTRDLKYIIMRDVQPNFLKTIYLKLIYNTSLSERTLKFIMMNIRGLFLVIFLPILMYINFTLWQIPLVLTGAFVWALSYYIGRVYLDKYTHNHSTEILAGLAIALYIYCGIVI